MSREREVWFRRVPERTLQRFTPQGTDALVREIEESAARGMIVIVRRSRGLTFSIVANGVNLLVRPHPLGEQEPVGTYHNAAAALRAGDRWVEAAARGEAVEIDGGDNWPRGAA